MYLQDGVDAVSDLHLDRSVVLKEDGERDGGVSSSGQLGGFIIANGEI